MILLIRSQYNIDDRRQTMWSILSLIEIFSVSKCFKNGLRVIIVNTLWGCVLCMIKFHMTRQAAQSSHYWGGKHSLLPLDLCSDINPINHTVIIYDFFPLKIGTPVLKKVAKSMALSHTSAAFPLNPDFKNSISRQSKIGCGVPFTALYLSLMFQSADHSHHINYCAPPHIMPLEGS